MIYAYYMYMWFLSFLGKIFKSLSCHSLRPAGHVAVADPGAAIGGRSATDKSTGSPLVCHGGFMVSGTQKGFHGRNC